MRPGEIKNATRNLGSPSDWDRKDGDCAVLPVRDRGNIMQSAWYPTPQEIALLVLGQPVILSVWGRQHPPVAIEVEAIEENPNFRGTGQI